jgi:methionyl-tRNA formyltransferase
MKYVFFGTPRFASLVLAGLLDKMPPLTVVANPDRPAGRKKVLTPPAVKVLLAKNHSSIELLQPEKLSEVAPRLRALEPDLFVVAAYGKIIPQSILDIPRLGTIGVHPSLLPRYRGATPIQSAILSGEKNTGVTLYLMDAGVDHGPILTSGELAVDEMNYPELEAALAALGAKLLLETMPAVLDGKVRPQAQDESQATLTGKFETRDAFVPWTELEGAARGERGAATTVWQKIRAFDPEPGAWTLKDNARIKLLDADLKDGALVLRKVQRAGKNPERISGGLP